MSDFVESAKNIVSSAVSRTSWQAQKQLRVRAKQSEIDQLLDQRNRLLDELAKIAMDLYQQGKLNDAQLSRLCASIQELDHDVQNREQQLLEVKSEQYNVAQFAPAATANYSPPPVTPASPPPPSRPSAAAPGTSRQVCPNCGNTVRTNALYCRSCGAKLR
jgi:uncharacterized protein YdcH (DUF465 family)